MKIDNINKIPVWGWILSLMVNASMSVPFWLCWSQFGLGRLYFDFLPRKYQWLPFWHCVGLFIVIGIIKTVLTVPLVTVSQSQKVNSPKSETIKIV